MKQTLITAILLFFFFSSSAQLKFGAGAALNFDGSSFGLQGKGHYTINEEFAGQGSFTYYFEDFTAWALDLDVHYAALELEAGDFSISPFAGLNFFKVSVLGFGGSTTNINLGVNATKDLGNLELFIEPKITLGNGSSLNVAGGVYF